MPYNNPYNQQIAKRYTAQQYKSAENRDALNGGSLEAVGLDGSGASMSMKVAPVIAKICDKLVASGYNGGNMAFVEKMLNEKFEKHGLPKSMIPTITKLIHCFNTKGELNDIINALPLINAIVKPLIGGVSSIGGGVSSMNYQMGSGASNGCGRCGGMCGGSCCSECSSGDECGGNFGMSGKGISSIAQMASAKADFYDREYRPMKLEDPILNSQQNRMIEGGYRTKGAKDVKKRCPKGNRISRATNECTPHRNNATIKRDLNRTPGDSWIEQHPSYSAPKNKVSTEPKPKRTNTGAKARATIVKQVMAEKGLSMIEASKYVKANNLYQPQSRAKIDLGATHMNLPPSLQNIPKPFNKGTIWTMMPTDNEKSAPPMNRDLFKAPKKAKKAKAIPQKYEGIPQKFHGEVSNILRNAEEVFATDPRARELFKGIIDLPQKRTKIPPGARELFDAMGVSNLPELMEKRRQSAKSLPTKAKAPKKAKAKAKAVEEDIPARPDIDISMLTAPEQRRFELEMNRWAHSNFSRHFDKSGNNKMPVREIHQEEADEEKAVINRIIRERNKGSGAGMEQKEELMAQRNGQNVALNQGVRGKKTGGRKLVPISQLPSRIGGGFFDDIGQAFRYTPIGMASDALQGRPTVFNG